MARRRAIIRQGGRPIGAVAELVRVPALSGGTAAAAAGLADELNRVLEGRLRAAEERATREGLEAGRMVGVDDPTARMDPDTVRGAAFNRGAIETGARRLETQLRTRLDELAREHTADPGTLQAQAEEYIAGVAQALPNDLRPLFQTAAETALRPYVTQATREQERAIADERLASFEEVTRQRLNDITRNARNAAADPAAAAAVRQDLDALQLDLVALGPRHAFTFRGQRYEADPTRAGAISLVQMERQLAAIERETAEQAALGAYERGPRTNAWIDGWVRRARQLGVPGLDQDGIDRLEQRMRTDATRRERAAERERQAQLRLLGQQITEANRLALAGYMPGNIDELQTAAAGTELADAVREVRNTAFEMQRFRMLPASEQAAAIGELDQRLRTGQGSLDDLQRRDRLLRVYTTQQQAAQADALAAFAAATETPLPPLDLTNPESLNARVRLATEAAVHFGLRGAAPFTAAEADQLVRRFAEAPTPQDMIAVLRPFLDAPAPVRAAAIQLFEQQRGDNRLPAGTMALVMDAMRHSTQSRQVEALVGSLLGGAPQPDQEDSPQLRTVIQDSMDAGVTGVRRRARQVTGDMRSSVIEQRDRQLIERLARQRVTSGETPTEAVANARSLLFGHLQTIDERNFAHVYLPATEDANTFRRGLRVLRLEAAMAVLQAQEPPREGAEARGDAMAIERRRHLARAFALQSKGVWINNGGRFALVAPETGQTVAMRQLLNEVTLQDVINAGRRVQDADRELQRRFDQEYAARLRALERQTVRQPPPVNAPDADPMQPIIAP
jgi:hypothetical protein